MSSPYEKELTVALAAVKEASRLCVTVQQTLVSEETLAKKDRSPVTVADYGAQALVLRTLAAAFPDDPVVAEEDAVALSEPENAELRERVISAVRSVAPLVEKDEVLESIARGGHAGGPKGRFWTLDPIDGTKGFLRKEQYAVALALIEDGEVVLGVLGCPNLPLTWKQPDDMGLPGMWDEQSSRVGAIYSAIKGQGAYVSLLGSLSDRTPLQAQQLSDVTKAVFVESVESGHSSHDDSAKIAERLGVTVPPVRMDSQCKYAAVARGEASIYLRLPTRKGYEEKIWDHAAGYRVLLEAGARVGDITGAPLDFSHGRTLKQNKGVVAASSGVFDEVVGAVKAVLKV